MYNAYWDRFDIASAYYHFAMLRLGGFTNYQVAIAEQLDRMRYKPGLSDSKLATISPNAKAIYCRLVHKHVGVKSTAQNSGVLD